MELLCECLEPPFWASLAKDAKLALSGNGGVSLFPLSFLDLPNKDRPPLDCRAVLSPEENIVTICACRVLGVYVLPAADVQHA